MQIKWLVSGGYEFLPRIRYIQVAFIMIIYYKFSCCSLVYLHNLLNRDSLSYADQSAGLQCVAIDWFQHSMSFSI